MRITLKTVIAAGLIAAAPGVFAATQVGNHQERPAGNMLQMTRDDSGMGHGMSMKNGDMPMMKMMETCNKMMQSKMENMNGPDGSTDKG